MNDPFGTADIRERVLHAWTRSPARFREDANAEEDLRIGGYRDRVIVELAQNAADAAGSGGELRVSIVDGELRVTNTGKPLDGAGVSALATLRASAKRDGSGVGRFGVGFAAVLAVSAEPTVVSRAGGVRFSLADTRTAVAEIPELADELAAREGAVPVLRLPWPCDDPPPDGFSTEIRLPLADGVDGAELLADADAIAEDLLLALPALTTITVGERARSARYDADRRAVDIDGARWVVSRSSGILPAEARDGLGTEESAEFGLTWAVRVGADGAPLPLGEDVLHTPTPTDERLSLPARLLAGVPMEPTRRRVRAGAATEFILSAAADAYADLLRGFTPALRLDLLPLPGFPLSEVDSSLRTAILERAKAEPMLATARGAEIAAARAVVLANHDDQAPLADLLPGLLASAISGPRHAEALRALDVGQIGLAEIADATLGVDRPPSWWRELYAALATLVDSGADAGELGALCVPLADGRVLPGPRGVLLLEPDLLEPPAIAELGLPIAHPDVVHPLLHRLGARQADGAALLESPELRAAVERSVDAALAGLDVSALVDVVLRLVSEPWPWLRALALADTGGQPRRADELLLPDAALRPLLEPEVIGAELGLLDEQLADRYPRRALVDVGVLDGFAVFTDEEPTGPDHELADEQDWWAATEPTVVHAIRDLDLIADDRWEQALSALAAEPDTWRALTAPAGYSGWWIARYANLHGRAPREWRLPSATALAGIYDELPATVISAEVLAAAGVRTTLRVDSAADAAELLDRLADPERSIATGTVLRAHAELAEALRTNRFTLSDVDSPTSVRTMDGVTDAGAAMVADRPWFIGAVAGLVAVEPIELSPDLAELLDLPLASAELSARTHSAGDPIAWNELGAVRAACALLGIEVPDGTVTLHDPLLISIEDAETEVTWWADAAGVHSGDSEPGLARALAWTLHRWPDRHLFAALLSDPAPHTLLN